MNTNTYKANGQPLRIKIAELDYHLYNEVFHCDVMLSNYLFDGSSALFLIDSHTGETIAKCTICMEKHNLREGQVVIKDSAETEGMLEHLVAADIVSHPTHHIQTGHTMSPVCNLLKTGEMR